MTMKRKSRMVAGSRNGVLDAPKLFLVQIDDETLFFKTTSPLSVVYDQDIAQADTLIDESHKSSSHSNKLLVYNIGISKTRINNSNAENLGNI